VKAAVTRWHVAGALLHVLPEVRGKDRIVALVRGSAAPASLACSPITVRFGPGLIATVDVTRDGSFADVFFARYRRPTLVPVLEAVLTPGAVFFDVGANIGIYSLWASRLVGDAGRVYAFEPVPATARWLQELLAENHADNVTLVHAAASDAAGSVSIRTVPQASGLSQVIADEGAPADESERIAVPSLRLDQFEYSRPTLVKIDVEGFEATVVSGMTGLLTSAHPVVVFEAPDFGGGRGTQGVVDQFAEHGYHVWSLTPRGLTKYDARRFSHNLLALHPARHDWCHARIANARFPRSQNC
jgi:FkbM family methyltransferase